MVSFNEKHKINEALIKSLQERAGENKNKATKEVQDDIENLISNGKIDEVKQRIDSYKKLSEDHT